LATGNLGSIFTVFHAVDTRNLNAVLTEVVLSLALLKAPEAETREIVVKKN
jgi:hypothetical protein